MSTMTDVAQLARVSKMTVSRVLNGSGYVKEETRVAVMNAVQALNYRPNLLAKSLATGQTNIIAYVLPDIRDPFFGEVCKGITDICEMRGYNSFINNASNENSVEKFLNLAIDRNVDGVIFHHLCIQHEHVQALVEHQIKCLMIDNETELEDVIDVRNDNYGGAYMAAEHLIACGYRKIACVYGTLLRKNEAPPRELSFTESFQQKIWTRRQEGFSDALIKHGLPVFAVYHGRGSADMDTAYSCGQEIARGIISRKELPDAIYCGNDLIALGISSELLESGIAVPQTIALCGHDGLSTCRILYPRITTIVQPQYHVGNLAASTLIDAIQGKSVSKKIIIPSSLFVGDTT